MVMALLALLVLPVQLVLVVSPVLMALMTVPRAAARNNCHRHQQ